MSEHYHTAPDSTRKRRTLGLSAVLCLVLLGSYFGSVLSVLATRLGSYFSAGAASMGLLLSAGSIGSLLTAVFAGPIIDHHGPRRFLVAASIAAAGSLYAAAFADSYPVFLLTAIAVVAANAGVNLAAPMYILRLYPAWKRKSFAMNLATGVMPGLVFPVVVERLMVSGVLPFRLVLRLPYVIVATAILAVAGPMLFRGKTERRNPNMGETMRATLRERILPLLKKRRAWLFIGLAAMHGAADMVFYQWMPSFLTSTYDRLPIGPGVMLSMFSVGYFSARAGIVLMPDHVGRRLFLVAPGIVGGLLLSAGLLSRSPLLSALLYPLAGLFWAFEFPALISEAYRFAGETFGSFQGVTMVFTAASGFLLVNAVGLLNAAGVNMLPMLVGTAVLFIAFGLIALVSGIGREEESRP